MSASKVLPRAALMWLLQCAASGCWVASVLVYGNFEAGDRLQLAAALAWCLGNVLAAADIFASDGLGAPARDSVLPRAALTWLLQCAASGCWVASVLVYGNFETGDRLQLAAALAWCLGNVLAAADIFASDEPVAERTRTAQQDLGVAP
jgi:hypothetical protein